MKLEVMDLQDGSWVVAQTTTSAAVRYAHAHDDEVRYALDRLESGVSEWEICGSLALRPAVYVLPRPRAGGG